MKLRVTILLTHCLWPRRNPTGQKFKFVGTSPGGEEKSFAAQMQLFELEPVVSEMIEQAESEHAPGHRSTKKSLKHPGRQELPANLPRVERILPCTPDQQLSKRCGRETGVIGYEESSPLEVESAEYFVLVTKRETRRLKVSVRDYFSAILPELADFPIRCLPDLTPAVWVARHSETQPGYLGHHSVSIIFSGRGFHPLLRARQTWVTWLQT